MSRHTQFYTFKKEKSLIVHMQTKFATSFAYIITNNLKNREFYRIFIHLLCIL